MWLAGLFRKFRQADFETLIREAQELGPRLLGEKEAKKALGAAAAHEKGIDGPTRWKSWRQLIEINEQCEDQLRALRHTHYLLGEVEQAGLDGRKKSDVLGTFDHLLKDDPDQDLIEEIRERERCWLQVRAKVKDVMPDVFVVHAFLRLADLTGVEIASLLVGGLLCLGAIYTNTFYFAAIGTSVLDYFTWEDFTYQGLRVLREIAVAFVLVECLLWTFRKVRRRSSLGAAFAAHRRVLKSPVKMVVHMFLFTAVLTFCSGWLSGKLERARFFEKEPCELELATALDGSILDDVFLVGTTSRTAAFLQVKEWGTWAPSGEGGVQAGCEDEVPRSPWTRIGDYVGALKGVIRNPMRGEGESKREEGGFGERVLIMDRALVVCHARGDACLKQGRRVPDAGTKEAIAELTKRLETVAQSDELGQLSKEVDKHLNRHHRQVLSLIEPLGSESQ